jgi:LuxR family maltose regulon positive regulatory protein
MMHVPLLSTKFYVPTQSPNLVARLRLIDRLDDGLRRGRRLTLVSAPAGFGKTTLVGAWVQTQRVASQFQVAWLSLDEGDNDPARFLVYLAAALQTVGIQVDDLDPADTLTPAAVEAFLTVLVNKVNAMPDSLILVLDDYHLISAQMVHDALSFLIDYLPDNWHLVIATRADPPLPVARLRGCGQLTELRLSDLRFVPDEASEFLARAMGLALSASDVTALTARTEGWIAGLQMAALSLQGKDDVSQFVTAFTGSNRYILDYLLEEVLRRESDKVQTFLLQTSILDRLCAPLCDVVIERDDSQRVLEHLESSNLFILPLDSERRWYRYHRLFSDLLQQRLCQKYADRVADLHRRASAWFEQSGLMAEAIDHALESDLERAADLIAQDAESILKRGEVATFLRWVDALPEVFVRRRPSLCVFYAWMLLIQGRSLRTIESLLEGVDKEGALVVGRVTALRSLMAAFRGQISLAIKLARRALEQLPEKEQFVRTLALWILRVSQMASGKGVGRSRAFDDVIRMSQRSGNVMLSVMMICNQAEVLMREGQLHEAAVTFQKALDMVTDAHGRRLPIAGQALVGLGDLAREWNDLDMAEAYLSESIALTEQWTEVGPLDAYAALSRVKWAQGDADGVWEALEKARELAAKFDLTDLDDNTVAMFQARMWVAQGKFEAAKDWAEERDLYRYIDAPLEEEIDDSYDLRMRKYELLVLARLLMGEGRHADALKLLDSLLPVAQLRGRPSMSIEIHVLQGLAFYALDDLDRATKALKQALSLAEPEGYVRIFVDEAASVEGRPEIESAIAELLRETAAQGIAVSYVTKLLAALSGSEKSVSDFSRGEVDQSALLEPLSERELDVLRLLNTHLSSTEIAERLYISANTVRFHVKNIYAKLGVHSRSDAVQRAKELGLV